MSNHNKILQILKGADVESEEKLLVLKNKLNTDYTTCWYPCSAGDFRITHEIERAEWLPDLFVYTDYALFGTHFNFKEGAEQRFKYSWAVAHKQQVSCNMKYMYVSH